jgi:hypothetical protein
MHAGDTEVPLLEPGLGKTRRRDSGRITPLTERRAVALEPGGMRLRLDQRLAAKRLKSIRLPAADTGRIHPSDCQTGAEQICMHTQPLVERACNLCYHAFVNGAIVVPESRSKMIMEMKMINTAKISSHGRPVGKPPCRTTVASPFHDPARVSIGGAVIRVD